MAENRNEDWKKDPKLEDIDAAKLDMLQKLAEKGSGKSASDMLPLPPVRRMDSIFHKMKSLPFSK